ncbi:MAG: MBL fold metallo-hydrolase [Treponemataceae bacterium]|jgi:glyoxylase-like metal-dependent hydrolase (beta-lactamase superfamily II)|nr:MBL fold metallo-hydrolase [Treponemataceae bacterium]
MKIYYHVNLEGYSNCYIITNPELKEAIIVDPGKITKEIVQNIENEQYNLVAVLITHNHGSHTDGLSTIRKIYNPRIYAADSQAAGEDTIVLKGDGIFKIADFTIGYLSVPGHSTDSMCYKIGNVIFTGDTLSAGKIGSTNNSYAKKTLIANVQTKIFSQQECTTLLPGHGPPTSIEAEKFFNLTLGCPELEK